jgi:hypothetical protein
MEFDAWDIPSLLFIMSIGPSIGLVLIREMPLLFSIFQRGIESLFVAEVDALLHT